MLRNNKDYTTIATNKDGIKFQNEKLERLNEDFIVIREKYEVGQKGVVDEVVRIARKNCLFHFMYLLCIKRIILKF